MPGLVSFFLRLIRVDGRCYRLIARRRHGVGGLRRFCRMMQAIRRFGHDAAGRGYHGTRRGARGGYYASGSGLHAAGCAHRGAPRARGPTSMGFDPWLVAGPSAPAMHGAAAAPAPPPRSRDGRRRRLCPATAGHGRGLERHRGATLRPSWSTLGSCAPASLGFAAAPPQAGRRVPADVVVVSLEEGGTSSTSGR
ncbi:hypothetical protein ZWY2020_059607 [Hordeum vulgare]|nr:hypothetical protein ZWY2020_059607 [Hordeum vulgare]